VNVTIARDGNRWRVSKPGLDGWVDTREHADRIADRWRKEEAFAKAMWDDILADKPDLMPNLGDG
jgi:hypothetical protein